jgi:hypothetical protein
MRAMHFEVRRVGQDPGWTTQLNGKLHGHHRGMKKAIHEGQQAAREAKQSGHKTTLRLKHYASDARRIPF